MGLLRPDAGSGDHPRAHRSTDAGLALRASATCPRTPTSTTTSPRASTSTTWAGSSGWPPARAGERAAELLERVGPGAVGRLCRCGASRRACSSAPGLAQALVNDPELVILDEPMSGLDPIGRRLVRDSSWS